MCQKPMLWSIWMGIISSSPKETLDPTNSVAHTPCSLWLPMHTMALGIKGINVWKHDPGAIFDQHCR